MRIYTVILQLLSDLKPLIAEIDRCDPDLARQLRRASSSVALNAMEGWGSLGKNKRVRYYTALGSARETRAAIEVAEVLGYVPPIDPKTRDRFDHIIATLFRLAK